MTDKNINDDNVLEEAAHWRAEGRKVALATVIETWAQPRARSAASSRSATTAALSARCPAAASKAMW